MDGKNLNISFIFQTKNKILTEIHKLDNKKTSEEGDIPVKTVKDSIHTLSGFVFHNFNNPIFDEIFP